METIIWALDLAAVGYLCLWALRADKAEAGAGKAKANVKGKAKAKAAQESNNA